MTRPASSRPSPPRPFPLLALAVVLLASLAGCSGGDGGKEPAPATYASLGFTGSDTTGRDAAAWPDLDGQTLTVLDHGAFAAFDDAAKAFEALTGAKVEHIEADDAGAALNRAILERGSPSADVIYGIDNVLLSRAESAEILEPYTPLLAHRVAPRFVFFGDAAGRTTAPWPATPVDHGYIAVNYDGNATALRNATIANLNDVRDHAAQFVTEDPNTSSVGLGFLLATIATYGDPGWQTYWEQLFARGALVTAGWSEAYEQHFSAGYGADPSFGGRADKAIVASYTESPAYEAYYGRPAGQIAGVVTVPRSTFRQVQTMAILKGTDHLAAAQAWVEFTLTDAFQEMAAPGNAVYPVVDGIDVSATYGGLDPDPAGLEPATFSYRTVGASLEAWLTQWTDLCERHRCR